MRGALIQKNQYENFKEQDKLFIKSLFQWNASIDEEQELFNWAASGNDEPVKKHIEELVSS